MYTNIIKKIILVLGFTVLLFAIINPIFGKTGASTLAYYTLLLTAFIGPVAFLFRDYKEKYIGKVIGFILNIRAELGTLMGLAAVGHVYTMLSGNNGFLIKMILSSPMSLFTTQMMFVTAGLIAFILTLPLLLTSFAKAKDILGANWYRLHKLIYIIVFFGVIHGEMIKKSGSWTSILAILGLYLALHVYMAVIKNKITSQY